VLQVRRDGGDQLVVGQSPDRFDLPDKSHHRQPHDLRGDQAAAPAIMNFRHASVGTSSLNTVSSASRLVLPVQG
jgi:hypothetical protein